MYDFNIDIESYWKILVINWIWKIISWYQLYICMHYIGLPTSSFLSVVLWSLTIPHGTDKARMNAKIKWILTKYEDWWLFIRVSHPFTYPQVCTLLTSNSLLSMRNFSLALVIRLYLTYSLNLERITIELHVW